MKEMFRRRRLPHWDVPGATYFITSCLEGSIPAQGLLDLATVSRRSRETSPAERLVGTRLGSPSLETCLRALRKMARHPSGNTAPCGRSTRRIVVDALYFFAGSGITLLRTS